MQKVEVFIETSSRFRGNVERKCGYVLSTQLGAREETRKHFGRVSGTYHQAILLTMAGDGVCARSTTNQQWNVWVPLLNPVSGLHTTKMKKEEYGLMMNRSEENQNGCREQTRNEDEGIDGILEALGAYVCDELCCHRGENLTQEEMECFCCHCEMQQYTDKIREML